MELETMPHNVLCEQTVLGTALVNKEWLETLIDTCNESDFYVPEHRKLFKAIMSLVSKGKTVEPLSVPESLHGITQNLASKANGLKSSQSALDTVKRYSKRREIVLASQRLLALSCEREVKQSDLMEESSLILESLLSDSSISQDSIFASDGIDMIIPLIEKRMTQLGQTGIKTGYSFLDHCTGGFEAGHLIIVAARPAMGKTAFAQCLIRQIINGNDNIGVILFSLEMSTDQIMERFISQDARVPLARIRDGLLDDNDLRVIKASASRISKWPLIVTDRTLTVAKIKNEVKRGARKLRRGKPNARIVVFVDYLQLIPSDGRGKNREVEVGDISRSLKGIAKDCGVTVVSLAQLNRSCEYREDKRPYMADLRESGSIEQDADLVAFLYRDKVYNEQANDDAELILRKNRHGKIGTGFMKWDGDRVTFNDDDMLLRERRRNEEEARHTKGEELF